MQLSSIDWAIIAGYFLLSLAIGLAWRRRAGSGMVEYFVGGRSLPWWIAGTSMVATTFAADTPLWVTGRIAKYGLAGNWLWWSFAFGGMLTVFVFAKLWRRAEVLTDVEFIELRYAGKPAAVLRGFRAFYVAIVMNSIIIGWVTKAMTGVLKETVLFVPEAERALSTSSADLWLVAGMLAITGVYAALAGMWGVAITDVVQFCLAMIGCIVFAIVAVAHVGGTDALREKVSTSFGGGEQAFAFFPDFTAIDPWMPFGVFAALVLSQWWASWYPGAEPGGGGYIVQRMASCRDERHAVKATLFFQLAHYGLRPWPWILVGFAALAMHPEIRGYALAADSSTVPNPELAYPMLIREIAPAGLRGLLLVTFASAYMSTVSTQVNWGASYLVNDIYRRFINPAASERQLVRASRIATTFVLLLSGGVSYYMVATEVKIDAAWQFLLALGAGVGAVFLLRWFWWRINAWSEIVAMIGSIVFFSICKRSPTLDAMPTEYRSLCVASATLVTWLIATYLTRPEPTAHLLEFYRKIRPDGPGWRKIAQLAPDVHIEHTLVRDISCAVLGTAVIWCFLPGVGALIFGQMGTAIACLGAAAIAAVALFALIPRHAENERTN